MKTKEAYKHTRRDKYAEMEQHQNMRNVLNSHQKKEPQRQWTIRDQEFEDALWAS